MLKSKKIKIEIKNFFETLALAEREIFCEETKIEGDFQPSQI